MVIETARSPLYLNYIRSLPCRVRDCMAKKTDPHHQKIGDGLGGIGVKTSDFYTIPLCRKHHSLLTAPGWGQERFAKEYHMDLKRTIRDLLFAFVLQSTGEVMEFSPNLVMDIHEFASIAAKITTSATNKFVANKSEVF